MAEPSDEIRPEDEEFEGGAVKSFLEHLEDLRWMLIKSAAATLVGMMVCLFGVSYLVKILTWPLERANQRHIALFPDDTNQIVKITLGDIPLQTIELTNPRLGTINLGTNRNVAIRLDPVVVGSNTLLSMTMVPSTNENGVNNSGGPTLVYMDPAASFLSALHLAFFGGLFLASPFVLYFLGQFVMPALRRIEKRYFSRAFWAGLLLFLSGVFFAYYVIMPGALKFSVQFASVMGVSSQVWKAEDFFGFEVKFMLGMGLGFELPVVLLALVKIGILNYRKLAAMRRYMVVINLVLGALLTTPEVITQIFMAVALQILFEAAVWIAWYWEYQDRKKAAQADRPIDV